MAASATLDRTTQDVGNIISLEHINVTIPDQQLSTLFYIVGMGFARGGTHAYVCCHDDAEVFEFELATGRVTRTFPTAAGCEFIIAYQ